MVALNIGLAANLIILFIALFFRKDNTLPNKILALLLPGHCNIVLGNTSIVSGYFKDFLYIILLS